MVAWAPRLPPAVSGSDVRCGRVCSARVSAVPSPSWLGCRGVFFALFFVVPLLGVPVPGSVVPVPPSPFFRAGLLALFSFFRGVCLLVSVSLFPVGRCSSLGVAGFGWVVPLCLCGGPVFGAFRGGVWPPLVVLAGGLVAVGCFRAPSPLPPLFFSLVGGVCLFLPLPSLGWRAHWPAFSVVFRAAVVRCVLFGRVPAPWVGWAMYTVGSAPLLAGWVLALPAWRLRQAAACGSGLGGWGCSCPLPSAVPVLTFWVVRHRCCQARCGPVCGLRCWCVACWCGAFQGVRWLALVSPSG